VDEGVFEAEFERIVGDFVMGYNFDLLAKNTVNRDFILVKNMAFINFQP
jgi:hypothetical protein